MLYSCLVSLKRAPISLQGFLFFQAARAIAGPAGSRRPGRSCGSYECRWSRRWTEAQDRGVCEGLGGFLVPFAEVLLKRTFFCLRESISLLEVCSVCFFAKGLKQMDAYKEGVVTNLSKGTKPRCVDGFSWLLCRLQKPVSGGVEFATNTFFFSARPLLFSKRQDVAGRARPYSPATSKRGEDHFGGTLPSTTVGGRNPFRTTLKP